MRFVLDLVRAREGDLIRRRFEVALVLSLLLHGVALWKWFPHEPLLSHGDKLTREEAPLSLRLVPKPSATPEPPQASAREAPPPPSVRPPPRPQRVVPRPAPSPPILTAPVPAPPIVVQPPSPPQVATPAPPPPVAGDLSSFIAERRRARGESGDAPSTVDSEAARRDRAIASNLASMQTSTFGELPKNGGGTFQLRRVEFDDAQFSFFGWSSEINRRTFQVIDVRKGDNASIELAIVRKIISIIREHEPGDFKWESKRLGRDLVLSARQSDNAELEAFMLQEFFTASGRAR